MFVDVHCHLDDRKFTNLYTVIKNATSKDVKIIISNGLNHESNVKNLEISKKYSIVKPAFGIYPEDAIKLNEDGLQDEIKFINNNRNNIIAIGEVGLDGTIDSMLKQKEAFLEMIKLGEKLKLPLIVHSRKAEQDVVDLLESSNVKKAVMHCFTGNLKLAKKIEDNNWKFSIPLIIKRSSNFKKLVEITSISNLLTETDSPYLNINKEINQPCNVVEIAKEISLIKNLDFDETKNLIFMNYQKLFNR